MKEKKYLTTALLLASSTIAATTMLNNTIFATATQKNILKKYKQASFNWRLGEVNYIKKGSGSPILLVHDLNSCSSVYEWSGIVDELSKTNTVYAIDLLGCGLSEKPNITYTNYMYVQLICDFIKNVIKEKTDVIASYNSSPIVTMSCLNDSSLFGKLILVNPPSTKMSSLAPTKSTKCLRLLINTPVIGTLLYNITNSKECILERFKTKYFSSSSHINQQLVEAYYESAHTNGANCRFVNSSLKSNYTTANTSIALQKIDNSIIIIGGAKTPNIKSIITDYKIINPSVEAVIMQESKLLPHLESPYRFLKTIKPYISEIPD